MYQTDKSSCITFLDVASSAIEELLSKLCFQLSNVSERDDKLHKDLLNDLERCLSCGVSLAKADTSKCGWLCEILVGLLRQRDTARE
jgi:hypothetical protein